MSRAYKIHNPEGLYFISFAPIAIGVAWICPDSYQGYSNRIQRNHS